jgi:hypothetical protein
LIFDLELRAELYDAPAFVSDPIRYPAARSGRPYSGTLAGDTYNPAGSPEQFSVLSGPAWLSVSSDGSFSGTPGEGDIGLNTWQVQVSDGQGHVETTTMKVKVHPVRFPRRVSSSIAFSGNPGGGATRFGYRRARNASLRYTYEISRDMVTWTPMEPGVDYVESISDAPSGEEDVELELIGPNADLQKAFLRLRLDVVDPD